MMTEREAQWTLLGPEETPVQLAAFERWLKGADTQKLHLLSVRATVGDVCRIAFVAGYQAATFEHAVKGGR